MTDLATRWAALPPADRAQFVASMDVAELAEWERVWQAECRTSFLAWCITALAPIGMAPASHHRLIISELEALARGECDRLMIAMPPGSAKSTYTSKLLAPWWFARFPRNAIIAASHTSVLAEAFSSDVQRFIRDNTNILGYTPLSDRTDRWSTSNACTYVATGVGGSIAGIRADLALIDDPVRSRQDADSETLRGRIWEWYLADLGPRLKPSGKVILIMTRWHEDDLAGRLLETQRDRWKVVSLPALAEAGDPLGRQVGEPLWTDSANYQYGAGLLQRRAEYERAGALRDWHSLYMQSPRPVEGNVFDVSKIGRTDIIPETVTRCRAWDLAATSEIGNRDSDFTAGVLIGRTADNRYVIIDAKRARLEPAGVEQLLVTTAIGDGTKVRISLPKDPGAAGKAHTQYLVRQLAGYDVHSSPETGDKATRAAPFAAQINAGNVSIVTGDWNRAFLEELAGFPSAKHDDWVDSASRAFAQVLPPANPIPKVGPMVFITPRGDAWAGGGADYAPVVQIGNQLVTDPWRYR